MMICNFRAVILISLVFLCVPLFMLWNASWQSKVPEYLLIEPLNIHYKGSQGSVSLVDKQRGSPLLNTTFQCGKISTCFEDNLNIVLNYTFNISQHYLERLFLDDEGIKKLSKNCPETNIPVFVTAASANHFEEALAMIDNLHKNVSRGNRTIKLIFYDLGLNKTQSQIIQKLCECEHRLFPFDDYPSYFQILINYTWKPVIIQLVLKDYDFVMWIHSSVRFYRIPLHPLYEDALAITIKILHAWDPIIRNTHQYIFKALGEAPCLFIRQEIQAGWIILKRTTFTLRAIMRPWVSCALQYGCMAQDNAGVIVQCPEERSSEQHHVCHRFDQSVIAIILTRLFNDKMGQVYGNMTKYGYIWRG